MFDAKVSCKEKTRRGVRARPWLLPLSLAFNAATLFLLSLALAPFLR